MSSVFDFFGVVVRSVTMKTFDRRPMNERERLLRSHEAVEVVSSREVVVKQDHRMSRKFTFDKSFGQDSNQVAVYQSVVAPFIEEVLAGYNCTVFAYGQTGTGKTHTMIGEESPNAANSWDDVSATKFPTFV